MLPITLSALTCPGGRRKVQATTLLNIPIICPQPRRRVSTRRPGGKPAHMHRVYKIFEVMPNGSPQRVTVVSGLEFAKVAIQDLAKHTSNECSVVDATTHQVIIQMNVARAKLRATRRIFQIAYDVDLGLRRAELLRSRGYGVISVMGNQAAKLLLSSIQHYGLFIVGHAAPEETRREIVDWLRAEYPKIKILALNPPNQQILRADYNVRQNGPENWLPIVTQVLANSLDSPASSNACTSGSG